MPDQSNLFTPLKSKRTFEEIADQIRELIYAGVLKPGDRLMSERELANQFKTGRMVVREALRTLEQCGLIYIKQGSFGGAFIKDTDSTVITGSISDMIKIGNVTLRDLTEVRLGIEKVMLEFVFQRINKEDLALLRRNLEDAEQQIQKGIRPLEEHLNFHVLLAKSTKNVLFEMIMEAVMNVTKSFLLSVETEWKYIHHVFNSLKEIYKAIEEGNLVLAQEKFADHILYVNKQLEELANIRDSRKDHQKVKTKASNF